MSDMLDVRALMRLLLIARVELAAHETALNAMNVFPIPDGDTGTNMRATMDAGLRASSQMTNPDDAAMQHVVQAIARSAQGNSGVILAEYIQGFLSEARCTPEGGVGLDAEALVRGFNEAARRTRRAVVKPVEGTVISVADAAAAGAVQAWRIARRVPGSGAQEREDLSRGEGLSLAKVATAALESASRALEYSPQQLAVLRTAGVVDAGGAGLVILLDSLARICVGGPLPATSGRSLVQRLARSPLRNANACQVSLDGPGYEVMAVVEDLSQEQADDLRVALGELGESVVVAGAQGLYRLHIHTSAVVATLSAMREYAPVSDITVVRFAGPVQFNATIRTPDTGIDAYARALGLDVKSGDSAVLIHGECASRTGVELVEFLEEVEFALSTDAEMPLDIEPPKSVWLVAACDTPASAREALEALIDDGVRDEGVVMVLLHPDLPVKEKRSLRAMMGSYPQAHILHVDSGHAVQIGVSHE